MCDCRPNAFGAHIKYGNYREDGLAIIVNSMQSEPVRIAETRRRQTRFPRSLGERPLFDDVPLRFTRNDTSGDRSRSVRVRSMKLGTVNGRRTDDRLRVRVAPFRFGGYLTGHIFCVIGRQVNAFSSRASRITRSMYLPEIVIIPTR